MGSEKEIACERVLFFDHSLNNRTTTCCPVILVRPRTSIIFDAIASGTSTSENRSRTSMPTRPAARASSGLESQLLVRQLRSASLASREAQD